MNPIDNTYFWLQDAFECKLYSIYYMYLDYIQENDYE